MRYWLHSVAALAIGVAHTSAPSAAHAAPQGTPAPGQVDLSKLQPGSKGFPILVPNLVSVYTLQVASLPDQAAAAELAEQLTAEGLAPVHIMEADVNGTTMFRVAVGSLPLYPDAMLLKRDYPRFANSPILRYPIYQLPLSERGKEIAKGITIPQSESPVLSAARTDLAVNAGFSLDGSKPYKEFQALDRSGNEQAYRKALGDSEASVSKSDPLAGYVALNLAIFDIKDKKYDEALKHLEPVVELKVASTQTHREMAVRRYAWVSQQLGDRLTAYALYKELAASTRSDSTRSTCITELAGLVLELAESGKGTHEDARWACYNWYQKIPPTEQKKRAVLDLMFMETFIRQPKMAPDTAALLGEYFFEKYERPADGSMDREFASCMWQTGFAYQLAGKQDKALGLYERVLTDVPENIEYFQGRDPHAFALSGIAQIMRDRGNHQESRQILEDIVRQYPNIDLSKHIEASLRAPNSSK